MRKSDSNKIKELRGMLTMENYKPWIMTHEFPSRGRTHRVRGWKQKRIHHLLSDLEKYHFLRYQWEDDVVQIREQFPLLPIEKTFQISKKLGLSHPPLTKVEFKDKIVMTTDFLIDKIIDGKMRQFARSIKSSEDLKNRRVCEKLAIEKEYWVEKGVHWKIETEKDINYQIANNLNYLNSSYFWQEFTSYSDEDVIKYASILKNCITEKQDIYSGLNSFENILGWNLNDGLPFFKFLLCRKIIAIDIEKELNFSDLTMFPGLKEE